MQRFFQSKRSFSSLSSHMDTFVKPRNVAVIGASERKGAVSRDILENLLLSPFGGAVLPINVKRQSVLGVKAYPSIAQVDMPVDLAIIVTPSQTVPDLVKECTEANVKSCIVISAGFGETGEIGRSLQEKVIQTARKGDMRIIGPNCLGVLSPSTGLNASFSPMVPQKGSIGFVSQSGALGTALLDWAGSKGVGFSHFFSLGAMGDISWHEAIQFLDEDAETKAIVLYMETIGSHPDELFETATRVSRRKPILCIKGGRSPEAAKAASSHTGSIAGSDAVVSAFLRDCGILRVQSSDLFFHLTEYLDKQPIPQGNRLCILTNAGGPGILACDQHVLAGGQMATLSEHTISELGKVLPPSWSQNNPVDVLGDAPPQRFADALALCMSDPAVDSVLALLTPQSVTDSLGTAKVLTNGMQQAHAQGKAHIPVCASWLGGDIMKEAQEQLSKGGIPTSDFPEAAASSFQLLFQYRKDVDDQASAAGPIDPHLVVPENVTQEMDQRLNALMTGKAKTLTELESKQLLSAYGIPVTPIQLATTLEQAEELATTIGFPMAVKLHSLTITHKSDVGGVKLGIKDLADLRRAFQDIQSNVSSDDFLGCTLQPMFPSDPSAYEVLCGSTVDAQIGPVLAFGSGGTRVELFKDVELAIPPLNAREAKRLVQRTKAYTFMQGFRGNLPCDNESVCDVLVRLSQFAMNHRQVFSVDVNPLLVSPSGAIALDARVVLFGFDTPQSALPPSAKRLVV